MRLLISNGNSSEATAQLWQWRGFGVAAAVPIHAWLRDLLQAGAFAPDWAGRIPRFAARRVLHAKTVVLPWQHRPMLSCVVVPTALLVHARGVFVHSKIGTAGIRP